MLSCVYNLCRDIGQCAKTVHGRVLYSHMLTELQVSKVTLMHITLRMTLRVIAADASLHIGSAVYR